MSKFAYSAAASSIDHHLPILMFFFKVRSPSSGSLQKLHSCNRCPELRTWTWKETKHAHYSFHRNLRGDRIGNQNTLKVSFFLPPNSNNLCSIFDHSKYQNCYRRIILRCLATVSPQLTLRLRCRQWGNLQSMLFQICWHSKNYSIDYPIMLTPDYLSILFLQGNDKWPWVCCALGQVRFLNFF